MLGCSRSLLSRGSHLQAALHLCAFKSLASQMWYVRACSRAWTHTAEHAPPVLLLNNTHSLTLQSINANTPTLQRMVGLLLVTNSKLNMNMNMCNTPLP